MCRHIVPIVLALAALSLVGAGVGLGPSSSAWLASFNALAGASSSGGGGGGSGSTLASLQDARIEARFPRYWAELLRICPDMTYRPYQTFPPERRTSLAHSQARGCWPVGLLLGAP